jgi:hypothetical protein
VKSLAAERRQKCEESLKEILETWQTLDNLDPAVKDRNKMPSLVLKKLHFIFSTSVEDAAGEAYYRY